MAKFKGPVRILAWIEVEGEDEYDADERGRSFNRETLASMINWDEAHYDVFPDEFPEQIG